MLRSNIHFIYKSSPVPVPQSTTTVATTPQGSSLGMWILFVISSIHCYMLRVHGGQNWFRTHPRWQENIFPNHGIPFIRQFVSLYKFWVSILEEEWNVVHYSAIKFTDTFLIGRMMDKITKRTNGQSIQHGTVPCKVDLPLYLNYGKQTLENQQTKDRFYNVSVDHVMQIFLVLICEFICGNIKNTQLNFTLKERLRKWPQTCYTHAHF